MARLATSGFEDTLGNEGWSSAGSPTRVASPVNSGSWSLECNASEGIWRDFSGAQDRNCYTRYYFRVHTRPAAGNTQLVSIEGGGGQLWRITIGQSGGLQARTGGGGSTIGSESATIALDTWYVLETRTLSSSTNNDQVEARVYGVGVSPDAPFVNVTADRGWSANPTRLSMGAWDNGGDIFFDDIAINDSTTGSDNSWPGPIVPPTGEPAYPNSGLYTATDLYPSATSGTSEAFESPSGELLLSGSRVESYSAEEATSYTDNPVGVLTAQGTRAERFQGANKDSPIGRLVIKGSVQEEGPEPPVVEQTLFVQMAGHGQ